MSRVTAASRARSRPGEARAASTQGSRGAEQPAIGAGAPGPAASSVFEWAARPRHCDFPEKAIALKPIDQGGVNSLCSQCFVTGRKKSQRGGKLRPDESTDRIILPALGHGHGRVTAPCGCRRRDKGRRYVTPRTPTPNISKKNSGISFCFRGRRR